ncbi:MAG: GC-type dockerin domain-anchored protein [Planctomycetota bacterium]
MPSRFVVVLLALVAGLGSAPATQAQIFRPLGDLPGGLTDSGAYDVTNDGSMVCGFAASATEDRVPAVWTDGLGWAELPRNRAGSGQVGDVVFSMSGDGQVMTGRTDRDGFNVTWGVWEAGSLTNPGGLISNFNSEGTAVSDDGTKVVGSANRGNPESASYVWENGVATKLPDLTSVPFSKAFGISGDGNVILGSSGGSSRTSQRIVRWVNGVPQNLNDAFRGRALASSFDGSVIIGDINSGPSDRTLFRWTSESGIVDLGDLPGGATDGSALATDAQGDVIVGIVSDDDGRKAGYWSEATGLISLADFVTSVGGDLLGYELEQARGISRNGRFIVGFARNPQGDREAFLITIPDCGPADVNGDGLVTPADFSAWILAFNSRSPACDQNGDGLCLPNDFSAWVLNFNAGCP